MIEFVFQGIVLGLSLAAPPGPVNAIIAAKSLSKWYKGFLVGLGAMTADIIFMAITVLIGAIIPRIVVNVLSLFGSVFLMYLAYKIFRQKDNFAYDLNNADNKSKHLALSEAMNYLTGLLMGLTNPFQIFWWIGVGMVLAKNFGIAILFGFLLGILIWILTFSISVEKLKSNKAFMLLVKTFSVATLIVFAIYFLYNSATFLIHLNAS